MRSRYRCSMCPAIHINSRSWLRSSSTREPSDPPLRVVYMFHFLNRSWKQDHDDSGCSGTSRLMGQFIWQPYIKSHRKSCQGGRKTSDGSLNLRNAGDVTMHAWVHTSTTSTLISTIFEQSRQVPRHFNKYSRTVQRVRLTAPGFQAESRTSSCYQWGSGTVFHTVYGRRVHSRTVHRVRLTAPSFQAESRPSSDNVISEVSRHSYPHGLWQTRALTFGNDPSAGSPTETLLRLLLPLDDQV